MSRPGLRRWPVWGVMLAAAALTVAPLPTWLEAWRPPWVALVLVYWCLMWPRYFGVGSAWLIGLLLDVLHGTLLGQHALALSVVAYLVLRFHLQMRIFPLWQLTMTVFALLAVNAFIVLWVDGLAGQGRLSLARWAPVVTGVILWAPVMAIMDRIRERLERRDTSLA